MTSMPPNYAPAQHTVLPPTQPSTYGPSGHGAGNGGSKLEGRDYYLLIDASGSMEREDIVEDGVSMTRWKAVAEGTVSLAAKILRLDPDGVTLYVFSRSFEKCQIHSTADVERIFEEEEPMTSTNLTAPLEDAFKDYWQNKRAGKPTKGATILVVTDGRPNHPARVIDTIVRNSQLCTHPEEVGMSFIQIGRDSEATGFLNHLDNNLRSQGAKYDIVDTKTWDYVETHGFKKVLLEAING